MPTRIVQLTDCHLYAALDGAKRGFRSWDSLRAVLDAVASEQADLLLLTGDLSEDGSPASYRRLAAWLAELGLPLRALPGNHDDPEAMAAALPKGCMERVLDLGPWRSVLLHSRVPGQVGGALAAAELERLAAAADAPTHLLVALHHHVLPVGSAWIDALGLEDPPALRAQLARCSGVRAVLSGHIHQEADQLADGIRYLTCPSTCWQFLPGSATFTIDPRPPGYRVVELADDGSLATRVERVRHAQDGS